MSATPVVLVAPYYRPVVGGITTFVSGLSESLAELGIPNTVLTPHGSCGGGAEVGPVTHTAFIQWARRRISDLAPLAVHAHGHWYCLATAWSSFGRKLATRVVFTVHTALEMRPGLRAWAFRRLLSRTDTITFPSEASRERFRLAFGEPAPLQVSYPGIRMLRVAVQSPIRRTPARIRICAVSMMVWPEKVRGLRLLLEAYALVRKELRDSNLVIVGDGEYRGELEAHVTRLGISDGVVFTGELEDPGPVLASSDIFCHISFHDAFPQAPLEALSMGVPVIRNEGGLSDIESMERGAGTLRVGSTPEAIASGILGLAANPTRRHRLGLEGAEFVRRRFTWATQGRHFAELYGLL